MTICDRVVRGGRRARSRRRGAARRRRRPRTATTRRPSTPSRAARTSSSAKTPSRASSRGRASGDELGRSRRCRCRCRHHVMNRAAKLLRTEKKRHVRPNTHTQSPRVGISLHFIRDDSTTIGKARAAPRRRRRVHNTRREHTRRRRDLSNPPARITHHGSRHRERERRRRRREGGRRGRPSASKQALGGNFSAGSLRLANRVASRKVAAQMAQRTVLAVVAEEVQAPASKALYDEFAKLLVNYEFSYKSGGPRHRESLPLRQQGRVGRHRREGCRAVPRAPRRPSRPSATCVLALAVSSTSTLERSSVPLVETRGGRDARGVGARLPRGRRRATRFDGRFFFRFARSDFA